LGGLTMAATGIGGMELAQGLSEQKADKDAEADMSRYIETFQCKIGEQGAKINGGDTNISTPGANQLINLYQEYVNLAADLRERKQALGMRAGIEAEVILDKASTGLYDDKGTGIENGTYASLYRASQGNQQDADKLSDLKDTSKKRVIGGAVAAGVGVIGGIVGNLVINKDKIKNEISTERENIKSQYNNIIAELVDECNKTIQSHKDFIATLTPNQLANKDIADYKQDVEAAQFVHTLSDIKESLFCK
ncbi:MAG: hypothetical protein KBT14_03810, partial [Proteobacteria bacterium]|nr:hypothetical protein [Candidatus Enterousia onthequi]